MRTYGGRDLNYTSRTSSVEGMTMAVAFWCIVKDALPDALSVAATFSTVVNLIRLDSIDCQ